MALPITEQSLKLLVDTFYARVREDDLIGPVFNGAIEDWPDHLDRLQAFWSSVMLTTGRYKGKPVPAHVRHGERISPAMFTRWLALWQQTTEDVLPAAAAKAMQAKAARIAESLMLAIQFSRDRSLGLSAI